MRPTFAVALAYAAFTLLGLALHGWTPLWFVWIGERWSAGVAGGRTGYDGQFVYYIARDGWAALPHLDAPGYRFARILYALLARGLSGGQPALLPWAMLAINYAAVLGATAAGAAWLKRQGTSPWWATAWAASAGVLFAYSRDCTEPLAYALALAGSAAWLSGRRAAGLGLLALAPLARETAVAFAAGLAVAAACERRWHDAARLAATALPLLAWLAWLAAHVPAPTAGVFRLLSLVPLAGALPLADLDPPHVAALLCLGLPALALLPGALAWIARQPHSPFGWWIAVHALLILLAPAESYLHVLGLARVSVGLMTALLLAFPCLSPGLRAAVTAVAALPTAIWLGPMLWWAPWTAER